MDALLVGYKPPFISSNAYLSRLKREFGVKKAGFSGTLDPFASGVLIVAFGSYTKLFRFLKKSPKLYRATLWLGAESETLDIESKVKISDVAPFDTEKIHKTLRSFEKEILYTPPAYSAKKIEGIRAYKLARSGKKVQPKTVRSHIYSLKLLNYSHPFLSFEALVEEGTYIRSLGELIAGSLGTVGILSSLERVAEGKFVYEKMRFLDPIEYLNTEENILKCSVSKLADGKILKPKDLEKQQNGIYHIVTEKFFSIIQIEDERVFYLLNKIPRREP